MLPVESYNLATKNKWFAVFPFKQIDSSYTSDTVSLNLKRFVIPGMGINSTTMSYGGSSFPIPTGTRNYEKRVRFEYMLSSDYNQYAFLYKWINMLGDEVYQGSNVNMKDAMLDVSVYILSEFKNAYFHFLFKDSWISGFDQLDLDQAMGSDNVTHGFSLDFSLMQIVGLVDLPTRDTI